MDNLMKTGIVYIRGLVLYLIEVLYLNKGAKVCY